jgi:hypothetical protein
MDKYVDGSEPPQELSVGDKVVTWENPDHPAWPTTASAVVPGVIVEIVEVDCDYDDAAERPMQYGPYVRIQWPEAKEGDLEEFSGSSHYLRSGYRADDEFTYHFDDIVKVMP